jgi:hypothetical protein
MPSAPTPRSRTPWAAVFAICAAAPAFGAGASSSEPHPPDPFAQEYRPPVPKEVGTAAGQVRLLGAAGAFGIDPELVLQATVEQMTSEYLGMRLTAAGTVTRRSAAPTLVSARVGPSLHLLPYRRADLTLFFEGGGGGIDLLGSDRTWMPVVAPGTALDLALGPSFVVHLEGQLVWGIYARQGAARTFFAPTAVVGLGSLL